MTNLLLDPKIHAVAKCVPQRTDLTQAMNYGMGAWQSLRVEIKSA